jgi:hypothetical protein
MEMTSETKKKLEQFLELMSVEGDIKGQAKLGDFLKKNVIGKFESLNLKLDELSKKIGDIKLHEIPKTDLSGVLDSIKNISKDIRNIKFPQPKEIKIPEPKDWTSNLQAIYGILGELLKMVGDNQIDKKEYQGIKDDLTKMKGIGRTMYQDWGKDSTEDGTLEGDIDGVNTDFVLRSVPVNGVCFVFRNGTLENLGGWSLSNKTITLGWPAQIGDKIEIKYPK